MQNKFIRSIKGKIGENTLKSIQFALNDAQTFLGSLDSVTPDDLMRYLEHLDESDLSEGSKALMKAKLKQFYAFCYDESDDGSYLKLMKKLKGKIPNKKIHPQELVIPSEVKRMINVATNELDRVIISVLYESGIRIGELMALTVGMVQIDDKEQHVTFNIPNQTGCKTGSRTVLCVEVHGYVTDWLKCHHNPEPDEKFIPIKNIAISDRIAKLFNRAKIRKPCNAHMLRHAAITHWCNLGMQQNTISMRAWGIPDSKMLNTYIHLSEQMQADGYLKAKGMKGDEPKVINPLAIRCVVCGRLIQSGELCDPCKKTQRLSEENQTMQAELDKQNALIQFMMQKYDELINGK